MLTFNAGQVAADLINNPLFVLALLAWCSALLGQTRDNSR